ncbi:hypothetical protein [Priestia koreensis]|uniref:hypothetical protein n=1 Tax=Priestia koreensis TaxID=284581 RepID=UPI001F58B771|nr:hypothetical protein [Priestia koreensis]UNL86947.1 hypothetical protein IE339_10850 [Priestia koreensis]
MKKSIEQKLQILVSEPFSYFGRSSNLFWFGFCDLVRIPERRVTEREVATYALHVQTAWKLQNDHKILVVTMDVYRPSSIIKEEDFDWEEPGNSLFDEKTVFLLEKLVHAKVVVEGIYVSNLEDITILFSNA